MIDPQTWPPLCGAVAGCGALLILSGAAKLVRSVRGTGAGDGADASRTVGAEGGRTAVQNALRLNDGSWRIFEAVAGFAELAVGLLVCIGIHPGVFDALMACQGAVFTTLLVYVMRKRISGDCGCLARRRPKSRGVGEQYPVTGWSVARAVFIMHAGAGGALLGLRPLPALSAYDAVLGWTVALVTLALLTAVDLDLRTPRCRRSLLFPVRTTLAEVTDHDVYQAMAASLGATADRVLFRRSGCIDEFWFPTPAGTEPGEERFLEIKAGRMDSGVLALRAAIAERAPLKGMRTLRRSPQPTGRRARLPQ